MNTALIHDEAYFWHDTGNGILYLPPNEILQVDGIAESPESKRRVLNLLRKTKYIKHLKELEPRSATEEEILYYHTPEYVASLQEMAARGGGDAGGNTPFGQESLDIAKLSAGGVLTGIDYAFSQKANAYVLCRPPGHHAQATTGAGYCIFNNVVIGAKYAQKKYGVKKIAIIDWDVHHGNGTEDAFYDDPDVLFISLHQEDNYPQDRGNYEDVGIKEGLGKTINIPFLPGSSNPSYLYAFENLIVPVLKEFEPELILVSAGQDANMYDPLGRIMLTADVYKTFSTLIREVAEEICQGRLVVAHEGGYSTAYVPFCTLRVIEGLSTIDSNIVDPFYEVSAKNMRAVNILYPHQQALIDEIIEFNASYWESLQKTYSN